MASRMGVFRAERDRPKCAGSRRRDYQLSGFRPTLEGWKVPLYRASGKTLFRRSEIDAFMMKHLEAPTDVDVERIADEAVMAILGGKK